MILHWLILQADTALADTTQADTAQADTAQADTALADTALAEAFRMSLQYLQIYYFYYITICKY